MVTACQQLTRPSIRHSRPPVHPAYVAGLGASVPNRVVPNEEIALGLDGMTAEAINVRTGIRTRCHALPGQNTSDLAVEAGRIALERAGVDASEVDLILLATSTPDHLMPATACRVQHMLNATRAVSMDLSAACSGFVYGLWVGQQFIQAGETQCVLVIGADLMSRVVDANDRQCAMLFGDGAGAAVLTASTGRYRLGRFWGMTQGDQYSCLIRQGGTENPLTPELVAAGGHLLRMDGRRVFRAAVAGFCEVIERTAAANDFSLAEIDWVIPHQCNERIFAAVADKLGISLDRFWRNIAQYGNTAAASIPLALDNFDREHGPAADGRLMLASVGAGMTAGGVALFTE
jgi:3-oxoacyl-[acyl-carrier-protein] synthase III